MRTLRTVIVCGAALWPCAAQAGPDNHVRVYSVSAAHAVAAVDDNDVSDAHPAGWSYARPYVAGGNHYVFMLKRQTGQAQIFDASAGNMGSPKPGVYELGSDWTSAQIYYAGAAARLVLHRSLDGLVWVFDLPSNGTLGAKTVFAGVSAWKDKSDFVPFYHGAMLRFAATDRWTGKAAFHSGSDGSAVASTIWPLGWTSPDYLTSAAGTFRIRYKPLETPGDDIGHFVAEKVAADGSATATLSDTTRTGWTHVRFVYVPPPGGSTRVLFYDAVDGGWELRSFSTATGIGAVVGSGTIAANLVDLAIYTPTSTPYIYGVQEDGEAVLTPAELDDFAGGPDGSDADANDFGSAWSVFANMPGLGGPVIGPGGWELALMQSGRLAVRADNGMANHGEGIALDGTRHRLNWGSVTKVITSIAVVKLAERGEIDLLAPLETYLDPVYYSNISTENRFTTLAELIEYRSGWDGEVGCGPSCDSNWECADELASVRGCPSCSVNPDGSKTCGIAYANVNFAVARSAIEWAMGRQQPATVAANNTFAEGAYVDFLRQLWWDRAGASTMRCSPDPAMHASTREDSEQLYYHNDECSGYVQDECIWVFTPWPGDWYESIYPPAAGNDGWACSAGGIQSTAETMARMLASLRYERVLTPDWTAYLLQAGDIGTPRVGFYSAMEDDTVTPSVWVRGKNGGTPRIAEAVIHRFGAAADGVLITNQPGEQSSTDILRDAWLNR